MCLQTCEVLRREMSERSRPKHKKECKKRVAELRDELLFKQPESTHLGDCPICCLPLPIDTSKSVLASCCCKRICNGCNIANKKREILGRLEQKCAFCRKANPETDEEIIEQFMKRIEANDPIAMCRIGAERYNGGNYTAAIEYLSRAASLGDVSAHFELSCLYYLGQGVEKNKKKQLHHVEKAAIGGHPDARHNLGCMEEENGRVDRAAKHWIIAAKLGYDQSLQNVKSLYKDGLVSKDDFTEALRGFQTAVAAAKSSQREEAAAFKKRLAELEREKRI